MRNLLLEELKRAVQILEENPELKTQKVESIKYDGRTSHFFVTDRNFTELEQTLHAVRRHSIAFVKQSRGKQS